LISAHVTVVITHNTCTHLWVVGVPLEDDFGVAVVNVRLSLGHSVLERDEATVVDLCEGLIRQRIQPTHTPVTYHHLIAVLGLGVLLRHATRAIFERREDRGGYVDVVELNFIKIDTQYGNLSELTSSNLWS